MQSIQRLSLQTLNYSCNTLRLAKRAPGAFITPLRYSGTLSTNFNSMRWFATQKGPKSDNSKNKLKSLEMAAKIREAQDYLRQVQRKEELKFMCNDAVPIDLEGSLLLPVIP